MQRLEKRIRFFINYKINYSKLLFSLNALRPSVADKLVKTNTDICIEGFPRSGNSFFFKLFKKANPEATIAHHIHSPIQLIRAVNLGIPAVALVRKPKDAIASALTFNEYADVRLSIKSYILFYNMLSTHKEKCLIVKFDDLITNHDLVIERINKHFGTGFKLTNLSAQEAKLFVRSNTLESDVSKVPYPTQEKEERNRNNRDKVTSHELYLKAIRAFEQILE